MSTATRRAHALVLLLAASPWAAGSARAQTPPAEPTAPPATPSAAPVEEPAPPVASPPAPGAAPTPVVAPAPEPIALAPAPAAKPVAAAPQASAADADRGPSRDPDDVFLMAEDDPRIPTFLRALRAGKDSLRLGGWIQPGFRYVTDTEFNDDDADGFEFNNARLIGMGDLEIGAGFGAGFRFNFDVNRGNFLVRDTYGTLSFKKELVAIDVGQLKMPLGLAMLQSEAKLQFPVSPITRRLSFGRDLGAQIRSGFELGPTWIEASFMLANGEGGFRQRRNLDDEFVYAGRLEVAPLGRMELTEPDLDDSDFQLTLGFSAGRNGYLGNELGLQDVGAAETKIEGDVRMWFKGASVRAEVLRAMRGDTASNDGYGRSALVVQAGYVLPIPIRVPQFELVAKLQQYDVNTELAGDEDPEQYLVENTETRVLQFGANAYLAKHAAKIQVVYQLTDLLEGPMVDPDGNVLLGDAVLAFLQFAWL
jgi:hypothetical protein